MKIYESPDDAVKHIKSNQRVFLHGSAATPQVLTEAMARRKNELKNVEVVAISTLGDLPLANESCGEAFFINSLFVSANIRKTVNSERGGYVPVFLSEIGQLFRSGILPVHVALIHVSPPDQHGFCSLGVSVDVAKAAIDTSQFVLAQINPKMPRTHGDSMVHVKQIHAAVYTDQDLPEVDYSLKTSPKDIQIGKTIAEIIEDGSTLQMGIGSIPDAVLSSLTHHKDLGVHTEMFSDRLIDLVDSGAVTNKYKKKHPGKVVTSFAIGTRKLYDAIDDNPNYSFHEASYVNDTAVIRKNPKVVSINSCIEIDLTGQVCADSIGTYHYSGVGGQMDFIRGAALSEGGKPIMALTSVTRTGKSKIVPSLQTGAGVVTTRAHVHYVVTEHGITNLYGKNLRQRAYALMNIADPNHREDLQKAIFERFGRRFYPGL